MEELEYIKEELERLHKDYINNMKDIWTNNEAEAAEKIAKKEFTKFKGKQKILELAFSQIESGLEYLKDYKESK